MTVEQSKTGSIVVRRSETDVFCYYCFYFVAVTPSVDSKQVKYDIEVINSRDDGEEAELIELNRDIDNLQSFNIPSSGDSR